MNGISNFLKMHKKTVLVFFFLTWLCAFGATHIPAAEMPKLPTNDKTLHVIGYAGLTAIFLLALKSYKVGFYTSILAAILIFPAYGAIDEITQPFVNRYASFDDWLADIAGVAIVLIVSVIIRFFANLDDYGNPKGAGRVGKRYGYR